MAFGGVMLTGNGNNSLAVLENDEMMMTQGKEKTQQELASSSNYNPGTKGSAAGIMSKLSS